MKKILVLMTLSLAANANTNEKIDLVGTIYYSNQLKSFSVIYLKDEKTFSYFIKIKNKNEFQKMKSLIGKSIRVEGDLNWKKSKNEFFSLKEELSINKISIFELNSTALSYKTSVQDNLISREKSFKPYQLSTTIKVSDKTANTVIATAAVALSVVAGPVVLAPVAAFGVSQMLTQ